MGMSETKNKESKILENSKVVVRKPVTLNQ